MPAAIGGICIVSGFVGENHERRVEAVAASPYPLSGDIALDGLWSADQPGSVEPVDQAAFSLCELSDRMIDAGAWTWPSIAVHVRALPLILADDCGETEQAALILEGLSTILRRV